MRFQTLSRALLEVKRDALLKLAFDFKDFQTAYLSSFQRLVSISALLIRRFAAAIVQGLERQIVVLDVVGSIPTSRLKLK